MLTIGQIVAEAEWMDKRIHDILAAPKFSLLYIDVDCFKISNDLYGFNRGNKVLLYLTTILKNCVTAPTDFIGHIGGDDFVVILPHFDVAPLCECIISNFAENIQTFYDEAHLQNPPLVKNREGEQATLIPMTLSIAAVSNKFRQYASKDELADLIAKVKKQCKMQELNCYILHEEPEMCLK